MTVGSLTHIIMLICTAGLITLGCVVIRKIPKVWQTVMIIAAVLVCCSCIFFRYGMGLSWEKGINLKPLLMQQLQVCNFNFILLPLALITKFKLPKQYAFYFSMFAASTTLFALSSDWKTLEWYDTYVLNSWVSHSFAIASPLWMWSAGWIKPHRKYILPVSGCVFGYFTIVYIICEIMKGAGLMPLEQSFSFIYKTDGIPIFDTFHKWIPVPYWHLYLAFPIMVGFFFLLSSFFNRSVSFITSSADKMLKVYGVIGDEITLLHGGDSNEGYYLSAWQKLDDEGNEEILYAPGETIKIGKKNIVLRAVWNPISVDEAESVTSECSEEGAFVDG